MQVNSSKYVVLEGCRIYTKLKAIAFLVCIAYLTCSKSLFCYSF